MSIMSRNNGNGTRRQAALAGPKIQTNRWLAWSRQFVDRHRSIRVRRPAPSFMLAVRSAVIQQRIQRCYQMPARLLGQFNLSISPHFSTSLIGARQAIIFGSLRNRVEWFHLRTNDAALTARRPETGTSRLTVVSPAQLPAREGQSPSAETHFRHYLSRSAFSRIFVRLEESTRNSVFARFETVVRQSHSQLIHRITTERQRTEDLRRSLMSREQKTYATAPKIKSNGIAAAESTQTPQAATAWQSRMPDASPVNLERLTEQVVRSIDSRIIAHRERTGQIF